MTVRVGHPRTAIVTGANHGIGAATAFALAKAGTDIVANYLRLVAPSSTSLPRAYVVAREQDCSDLVSAIRGLGRQCVAIEADLCEPETPDKILAATAELSAPCILVNNASSAYPDSYRHALRDPFGRDVEEVNAGSATTPLLVDARGGALMIAAFVRHYRAHALAAGRIVSLTSGGAYGFPGEVSYGAAKAALENYTLSAAIELAEEGITANVVHPPITDTGWITTAVQQSAAASGARIATPAEVAEVIAWLCSDEAQRVTGNVIRMR